MTTKQYIGKLANATAASVLFSLLICPFTKWAVQLIIAIISGIFEFKINQLEGAGSIADNLMKESIIPGWGRLSAALGSTDFTALGSIFINLIALVIIGAVFIGFICWLIYAAEDASSLGIVMGVILLGGFVNLIRFVIVDESMQEITGIPANIVLWGIVLIIFLIEVGIVSASLSKKKIA
jgi:hypothetical protein